MKKFKPLYDALSAKAREDWLEILGLIPEALTITEMATGKVLYANPAAAEMYGFALEEMFGRTTLELGLFSSSDARQKLLIAMIKQNKTIRNYEVPFWNKHGDKRTGLFSLQKLEGKESDLILVVGMDVTEARQQEANLAESEARFRMLAEATLDIPWEINRFGEVVYIGPGVGRMGFVPNTLLGESVFDLVATESILPIASKLKEVYRTQKAEEALRFYAMTRDGSRHAIETSIAPVFDHRGEVVGMHGIARGVQAQVDLENSLKAKVERDSLTLLLNREGFYGAVGGFIAQGHDLGKLAMVYMDLDDFKNINDVLGHMVGDAVLCEVARKIQGALRPGDFAARLGGDEFCILLCEPDLDMVGHLATSLLDKVKGVNLAGFGREDWSLSASVGVCRLTCEMTVDEGINRADQAMYRAKRQGKNQIHLWE